MTHDEIEKLKAAIAACGPIRATDDPTGALLPMALKAIETLQAELVAARK